MWGKLSFNRNRRPTVGTSTLVDKTSEGHVYQSLSSATTRNHNHSSKDLPALPGDQFVPPFSPNRPRVSSAPHPRDARLRSSSSLTPPAHTVYGQPPGDPLWRQSVDISPPDSPDFMGRAPGSRGSSQVSPIEDEPKEQSSRLSSQLPVLRKGAAKDSLPAQPGPNKPSSSRFRETKWDDFSGEPTTGHNGRSAQAAPGRTSFHSRNQSPSKQSTSHTIFGWSKEQFQPKKKLAEARNRLKNDNTINMPTSGPREPWKGPSGRSPMISPIEERPRGRSSSYAQPLKNSDRSRENSASPDLAAVGILPSVVTTITANPARPEKRTVSKGIGRHHPEEFQQSRAAPTTSVSNSTPPRVDLPEHDLTATLADIRLTGEDEPGSRFSATTYAPTEAPTETEEAPSSAGSRRDSVDFSNLSTDNVPSIMSRKRPVPSMVAPGKMPTRKPTPSEMPNIAAPPEPVSFTPEQQTQNRIDALESRRDSLGRRRTNINTIIHELTQVIQPSPIAYDIAARDEVKKTVNSLNNELAEIKREEHEIGLKLLRAWKKRDEQDAYGGGSGLWVSRVSS